MAEMKPPYFDDEERPFRKCVSCRKSESTIDGISSHREWTCFPCLIIEKDLEIEALQRERESTCGQIAKMHEAAMGQVCAPVRGVVEDIADIRQQMIRENERASKAQTAHLNCHDECLRLERNFVVLQASMKELEQENRQLREQLGRLHRIGMMYDDGFGNDTRRGR